MVNKAPKRGVHRKRRERPFWGLSKVMIVIEAGEKGGTMNAGMETIKHDTPLYVAEYQDMSVDTCGNKKLLELGRKRLARSPSTGRTNMKNIFTDIEQNPAISSKQNQIGMLLSSSVS